MNSCILTIELLGHPKLENSVTSLVAHTGPGSDAWSYTESYNQ